MASCNKLRLPIYIHHQTTKLLFPCCKSLLGFLHFSPLWFHRNWELEKDFLASKSLLRHQRHWTVNTLLKQEKAEEKVQRAKNLYMLLTLWLQYCKVWEARFSMECAFLTSSLPLSPGLLSSHTFPWLSIIVTLSKQKHHLENLLTIPITVCWVQRIIYENCGFI